MRFVSISKIDKIKIITISYSNNEVYFYDLNKIIKFEQIESKKGEKDHVEDNNKWIENHLIKKYGKIDYNIPGKITALDTEFTRK